MTITVYNAETKEILACINPDDDSVVRKGIAFIIQETEPLMHMKDERLYLDENKFIITL